LARHRHAADVAGPGATERKAVDPPEDRAAHQRERLPDLIRRPPDGKVGEPSRPQDAVLRGQHRVGPEPDLAQEDRPLDGEADPGLHLQRRCRRGQGLRVAQAGLFGDRAILDLPCDPVPRHRVLRVVDAAEDQPPVHDPQP
jgi:hypothetical protein